MAGKDPFDQDLEKIAESSMRAKDLPHQILTFCSKAGQNLETILLKDNVKDALNLICRIERGPEKNGRMQSVPARRRGDIAGAGRAKR